MKKLCLIAIVLCLAVVALAQDVTVTTTAGNLRADLITVVGAENKLGSIVNLKINGTLNAQDFKDIKTGNVSSGTQIIRVLASLDLSGLTAVENNEIPENAFFQSGLVSVIFPAGGVITKIGNSAFATGSQAAYTKLTSITIPEGVTTIGESAFYGQFNVTNISLPSTLKRVEYSALSLLINGTYSKITSLVLPEGLTYIGDYAFKGFSNASMTSLTIPASVEYIGSGAFEQWRYVESITFAPRNGKAIEISGYRTFQYAGYSTGEAGKYFTFEFPDNTTISRKNPGDGILFQFFFGAQGINEVKNFPQTIKEIGTETFVGTGITSFEIPSSVTTIGANAFKNLKLTSIVIPNSVTSIGGNAFSGIPTLAAVTLGNSVATIGSYAFSGATAVESLELPSTLTTIGTYAFQNMTNLKNLIVNNPVPVILSLSSKVFDGIPKGTAANACKLYVPAESIDPAASGYNEENDYSVYDLWKAFMPNIKAIVVKQAQTIENFTDISKTVTDVDFDLTATATSGLTVTYNSSNTTVATISGSTVHIVGAGTTTITASQAGNDNYSAATDVTATLTVTPIDGLNDVRTQLPVRIQNGNIIVSAESGSTVDVFNAIGIKLQSQTANSSETTFSNLPQGQVLIVRSGNAVAKVIL